MKPRCAYLSALLILTACSTVWAAPPRPDNASTEAPAKTVTDTATRAPTSAPPMPIKYDAGRFFVEPVTANGTKLRFLTSTGDNNLIYSDVVAGLSVAISLEGTNSAIYFPEFAPEHAIPLPLGAGGSMPVKAKRLRRPYLSDRCSGILGQDWFAERVWTLDYPAKKLALRDTHKLPDVPHLHHVALGFRTDSMGKRIGNRPRLRIQVAGESISMLLNTGATIMLSDDAVKTLAGGKTSVRAASFITDVRLAAWQKAHGWRVIEKAEHGGTGTMIEVPKVTIAGYEVGPVWFTARPKNLYHYQISRGLDAQVDGAIGGNLLKPFRVTLDFPGGMAYFEKP